MPGTQELTRAPCEAVAVHTLAVQRQLQALLRCEQEAIAAEKALTVCVQLTDGQVSACMVTGGIGEVHFTSFTAMGLPSDSYTLRVCVTDEHGECPAAISYTTLNNTQYNTRDKTLAITDDIKTLHVAFPDGPPALHFDTFEIDGKVHWLDAIVPAAAKLEDELAGLFRGHDLSLEAWDDTKTVPWAKFEAKFHDLNNKLSRVHSLRERVVDRYEASPDEGWYAVFGDTDNISLHASRLRVCPAAAYRDTDLCEGLRAVRELEQCLQRTKATRLQGSVSSIVRGVYGCTQDPLPKETARAVDRHIATFSTLLDTRGRIATVLHQRRATHRCTDHPSHRHVRSRTWQDSHSNKHSPDLEGIVETRAHYLTLAAVDAALRRQTAVLCGIEEGVLQADVDLKLCRYQLSQIFTNNRYNDLQLSQRGFDQASATIQDLQNLTTNSATTNSATTNPALLDMLPFPVMRRLCQTRILEAFARSHDYAPDIAPQHNYMYSTGQTLGGAHTNPSAQAQSILLSMVHADRQNRILTPAVARHLLRVVASPKSVDVGVREEVLSVFQPAVRGLVRMALDLPGDSDSEGRIDPLAFLDSAHDTSGYDEDNRLALLVRLIFQRDRPVATP